MPLSPSATKNVLSNFFVGKCSSHIEELRTLSLLEIKTCSSTQWAQGIVGFYIKGHLNTTVNNQLHLHDLDWFISFGLFRIIGFVWISSYFFGPGINTSPNQIEPCAP